MLYSNQSLGCLRRRATYHSNYHQDNKKVLFHKFSELLWLVVVVDRGWQWIRYSETNHVTFVNVDLNNIDEKLKLFDRSNAIKVYHKLWMLICSYDRFGIVVNYKILGKKSYRWEVENNLQVKCHKKSTILWMPICLYDRFFFVVNYKTISKQNWYQGLVTLENSNIGYLNKVLNT